MGLVDACEGRTVYLDTNVLIYFVEGAEPYLPVLTPLFGMFADGRASAVTSELALAETLPKPLQAGRPDLVAIYEELLTSSAWLTVLPVARSVLSDAARLRAQLGLRLPDAIHVATAMVAGCGVLLSNDLRLRAPEGLQVLRLDSDVAVG